VYSRERRTVKNNFSPWECGLFDCCPNWRDVSVYPSPEGRGWPATAGRVRVPKRQFFKCTPHRPSVTLSLREMDLLETSHYFYRISRMMRWQVCDARARRHGAGPHETSSSYLKIRIRRFPSLKLLSVMCGRKFMPTIGVPYSADTFSRIPGVDRKSDRDSRSSRRGRFDPEVDRSPHDSS